RTLRIIPRVLRLGIGCRRGTEADAIESAVRSVLKDHGIDLRAVKSAASIDLKKDEAGLLEFCSRWELPAAFYTADELRSVPGDFTPSPFVEKVTGVDNVCERAAAFGGGRIIVKKTAMDGVTCAVAMEDTEVSFE
ncbi:MAG: cobalamin biosynthesis protein, partial [Firmicutes bacterium]|nr:cobalamin biosynthesis protein [Bacillota bacterium]